MTTLIAKEMMATDQRRSNGIIDDSGDRLGVRYDQVFGFIIGAM